MTKKLVTLLLISLLTSSLYSQEITFSINGSKAAFAKIFRIHGSKTEKVDSILQKNSKFIFNPDSSFTEGEYLFELPGNDEIHFLYTGSTFMVQANDSALTKSVVFSNSLENNIYSAFNYQKELFTTKKEELEKLAIKTSKNRKQKQANLTELTKLQKEY